jgi:5-dehydro-2-deoxygluconokinase
MLNSDCVFMLAADHRWQWDEWCDAHRVPRERIGEVKRIAFQGFLQAREDSAAVREFGALLIDEQYASDVVALGLSMGVDVGTPAERPGAFPLEWTTEPFERALTGTFVKVLIRHRPDYDEAVRDEQLARLAALRSWCTAHGKPLVVEVLVPRKDEPEHTFEETGRPDIVAAAIRLAYARGLVPDFWKIEGTPSPSGAREIDRAIAEHPGGRQIILGKGADSETITAWFRAAASSPTAVGFAIGRSVLWDAGVAYFQGRSSRQEAARAICRNYLALVDAWAARMRA